MTLREFGENNSVDLNAILAAKERTFENIESLKAQIKKNSINWTPNIDLVVFGSLGRQESTAGSDADWTLLVNGGEEEAKAFESTGILLKDSFENTGLEEPGSTAMFGTTSGSKTIIENIGGKNDLNHNLSKRLLLLLESEKVLVENTNSPSFYDSVISDILHKYLSNDSAFSSTHGKDDMVPRFLLNDIVRFWRTMCVDFAYKQIEQDGKKWALRNIKLRMSRKLIFVKGLLMCASSFEQTVDLKELKKTLTHAVSTKALDFVLESLVRYEVSNKWIKQLLISYDNFLALLNNIEKREYIEKLKIDVVYHDEKFLDARINANNFQEALTNIFLIEDTPIKKFSLKYGLF